MLELRNISYSVSETLPSGKMRETDILKNVNLTINDRFVAITGPNGSGKSTLAKIIAGIITPTSGQIFLDGEDITDLSITDRAKKGISFAFQQPVRFKGITVKDLISLAAGKKLSTGELKRIEIAMINARGTKFSVFDEPEAGIDLWSFQNLIEVFKKMHERTSGTILIISHQERILDIADKVIVIADGRVSAEGTKEEILPELLHASAGCRYTANTANC